MLFAQAQQPMDARMEPAVAWVVCIPVLLLLIVAAVTACLIILMVQLRNLRVRLDDVESAVRRLQDDRRPADVPEAPTTAFREKAP